MDNDHELRIARIVSIFRQAVADSGATTTLDGRVSEEMAAVLLEKAPRSLANYRTAGLGPSFYRIGGRVTYSLEDLARWIEAGRETTLE